MTDPTPARDGWRLVPVEPTPEMVQAGNAARISVGADPNTRDTWAAMLASAPTNGVAMKQRWALARRIYEARYPKRGAGLPAAHWDAMSKAERTPWLACADVSLASAPAPSGGVDAVREALLGYVLKPGQYETASAFARGQNRVAVDMLGVLDEVSLSPAATPVSEAGGEARSAEDVLRDLALYLSVGGYNDLGEPFDPEKFDRKIRWGIDYFVKATVSRCADKVEELSKRPSTRWGEVKAAIQAVAPELEPLAKPASSPAGGDVRERGWLVELKGTTPSWAILNPRDYDEHWTADSTKAIRFAREADAQAYIDHIGWTEAFPSEHIWDDGRREGSR